MLLLLLLYWLVMYIKLHYNIIILGYIGSSTFVTVHDFPLIKYVFNTLQLINEVQRGEIIK